jgi:hypothetical protein
MRARIGASLYEGVFFNGEIDPTDWICSTSAREHMHLSTLNPKSNFPKNKKTTHHHNSFFNLYSDPKPHLPYSPSPATVNGGDQEKKTTT